MTDGGKFRIISFSPRAQITSMILVKGGIPSVNLSCPGVTRAFPCRGDTHHFLLSEACDWLAEGFFQRPTADESPMILTLGKVMNDLGKIKKAMGKSPILINSPITNELKDCCIASALESFRHNMIRVSVTDAKLKKVQGKISRELSKKIILNGLPICKPEETQKAQCESSYREVNSQTFVQNFQTLLQKIYASQA
ncbi:unnamed protein product [Leuciscus chuanchicus]